MSETTPTALASGEPTPAILTVEECEALEAERAPIDTPESFRTRALATIAHLRLQHILNVHVIEKAEAEVTALRADLAKREAERDEAKRWAQGCDEALRLASAQRDDYGAENAQLIRERDAARKSLTVMTALANGSLAAHDDAAKERDAAIARAAKIKDALREVIGKCDAYGFNCGNDQSYVMGWIEDLRAALAATG